jgi:hypothetical protein
MAVVPAKTMLPGTAGDICMCSKLADDFGGYQGWLGVMCVCSVGPRAWYNPLCGLHNVLYGRFSTGNHQKPYSSVPQGVPSSQMSPWCARGGWGGTCACSVAPRAWHSRYRWIAQRVIWTFLNRKPAETILPGTTATSAGVPSSQMSPWCARGGWGGTCACSVAPRAWHSRYRWIAQRVIWTFLNRKPAKTILPGTTATSAGVPSSQMSPWCARGGWGGTCACSVAPRAWHSRYRWIAQRVWYNPYRQRVI